jgi:hypothetical protein
MHQQKLAVEILAPFQKYKTYIFYQQSNLTMFDQIFKKKITIYIIKLIHYENVSIGAYIDIDLVMYIFIFYSANLVKFGRNELLTKFIRLIF